MKTKLSTFQVDLISYHLFLMDLTQEAVANDLPQLLIKSMILMNASEVKGQSGEI